jgi:hypothetical protein
MKRLFILLMVTTMSFGGTQQGVEKVYDDSKETIKTLYGDVKSLAPELRDGLGEIAKGLKTTSEKAWDILVTQQQVWSWCYLFVTLSAMFLWFRFYRQYKSIGDELTDTGEFKGLNVVMTILLFIFAIIDSVIAGVHFEQMLTGFLNPEFGVLRTIIEMAIKLK